MSPVCHDRELAELDPYAWGRAQDGSVHLFGVLLGSGADANGAAFTEDREVGLRAPAADGC